MPKDRETRMKETLQIMGLNKYMYALSFLLSRAMWTTVTALIMAFMIYFLNMDSLSFGIAIKLFFAIWLLSFDFLGMSLCLQNLFSNSKLATLSAPLILFLPTGLALVAIITPTVNNEQNVWV